MAAMALPPFVHLHLHSEFSLVDGLLRIKPLVAAAAKSDMPAIAVTDQVNLFALVRFYKAAQAAGIKPLVGVDLWIHEDDAQLGPSRLVLLCQNLVGYRNLTRLVSRAYTEGQGGGVPALRREWLRGHTEGLLALSAGMHGDVGRALLAGKTSEAQRLLADWLALFPDRYYLELIRTKREKEEDYLHLAVELALAQDVPVVASNDVRFLSRHDFEAHEARVCIHDNRVLADPRRPRRYSEEQYLKSPQEMAALFADLPEALANTVEIAKRCNLELSLGKAFLPDFPVPDGLTMDDYFRGLAQQGLEVRLARLLDATAPDYLARR